ncbi:MAG TPA: efflux RND transporter periplasmic adaptor subunit [Thermoanaerobaculia bacterium]|nr:efflux RND transporter periplasmic adaptor subunit [Thermoanaerobaculia bacterium]
MSRKLKVSLAVAGVLVAGLAVTAAVSSKNRGITRVLVAKVKDQDIVAKVTANGKIQAENRVELSALVQGQIVNLVVKEGDRVKKGDFLLQIDRNRAAAEEASSAAAAMASVSDRESAKTAMEQAWRDYQRLEKNFKSQIAAEADLQKARATYDAAKAAYEAQGSRVAQTHATHNAFRDTLSKTTVVAPLDGVVTTLPVKAGEVTVIGTMNNAGTQLMTISDLSSVLAVLMVDETDTTNVSVGQKAVLTIDAYQGQAFEGTVTEVGSSPILKDDPDLQGLTTTSDAINFKVKVKLAKPPPRIRPGFSVSADIITGTKKSVPSVPLAAVVVRDSPKGEKTESGRLKTEDGVYLLKGGKAVFTPIKTGLAGELQVEVADGLATGQDVITGPFKALRTLKDGDRVVVATEKERKELEAKGTGT